MECKIKKSRHLARILLLALVFLILCAVPARAEVTQEDELYEKSGASGMYDSLDGDTRELLSKAGVDSPEMEEELSFDRIFQAISQMLREKLSSPLKTLAALIAIILLCRLGGCFEKSEIGAVSTLVGTVSCAAVIVVPMIGLIDSTRLVMDSASVFLLASIPVYSALMVAAGNVVTGGAYSFFTLAAANAVPLLSAGLIIPILNIFLAFAVATAVSQVKFEKLTARLYQFCKWLLILLVTVFSGLLSLQTMLNMHVDSVTAKTAKLIASSAIPIVGGAFSDALSAIQSSIQIVKSGVGAFGILASLFIFLPVTIEAVLWVIVCSVGEIAGDLFEVPKLASFLGVCASVARMILAVIISTAAVSIVSASIVLLLRGNF